MGLTNVLLSKQNSLNCSTSARHRPAVAFRLWKTARPLQLLLREMMGWEEALLLALSSPESKPFVSAGLR